jgi:hypothetical protein
MFDFWTNKRQYQIIVNKNEILACLGLAWGLLRYLLVTGQSAIKMLNPAQLSQDIRSIIWNF